MTAREYLAILTGAMAFVGAWDAADNTGILGTSIGLVVGGGVALGCMWIFYRAMKLVTGKRSARVGLLGSSPPWLVLSWVIALILISWPFVSIYLGHQITKYALHLFNISKP